MAKTNINEASKEMKAIANELAKHLNLTHVEVKSSDFWADAGTEEISYRDNITDNVEIVLRYRFGNPRIDYKNGDDFAAVELGQGRRKRKDGSYEYDGIYRPYEIQAWGACGMAMAKALWDKIVKRIHVSTNHFYK